MWLHCGDISYFLDSCLLYELSQQAAGCSLMFGEQTSNTRRESIFSSCSKKDKIMYFPQSGTVALSLRCHSDQTNPQFFQTSNIVIL